MFLTIFRSRRFPFRDLGYNYYDALIIANDQYVGSDLDEQFLETIS